MTVSPDARTPSASVHALSGSTPPGAARPAQPFGIATGSAAVAELPDTFALLGTVAADVMAGLAARRAAAVHPDAEVVDLAGRVTSLGHRLGTIHERRGALAQRVEDLHPKPSLPVSNEVYHAYNAEIRPTEESIGLVALRNLNLRQSQRMTRWLDRLAAAEPRTLAGLAAKSEAFLALSAMDRAGGLDDFDVEIETLGASQARDAIRIAAAPAPSEVGGGDDELKRLHRAYEASGERCQTLAEATGVANGRMRPPPVPDALKFRARDDASCIGADHVRQGGGESLGVHRGLLTGVRLRCGSRRSARRCGRPWFRASCSGAGAATRRSVRARSHRPIF